MRIQVLHLPAPPDEFPFAIVIDQCHPEAFEDAEGLNAFKRDTNARAVLVTDETVEVV